MRALHRLVRDGLRRARGGLTHSLDASLVYTHNQQCTLPPRARSRECRRWLLMWSSSSALRSRPGRQIARIEARVSFGLACSSPPADSTAAINSPCNASDQYRRSLARPPSGPRGGRVAGGCPSKKAELCGRGGRAAGGCPSKKAEVCGRGGRAAEVGRPAVGGGCGRPWCIYGGRLAQGGGAEGVAVSWRRQYSANECPTTHETTASEAGSTAPRTQRSSWPRETSRTHTLVAYVAPPTAMRDAWAMKRATPKARAPHPNGGPPSVSLRAWSTHT